jgi:hypothetical protein
MRDKSTYNTRGLKPFPKGVSGNPNGRPKKRPVSDRYAKLLELEVPPDLCIKLRIKKGTTFGDAIALRQALQAVVAKNHSFAKEIREAIEGKAPQRIEIASPEDGEINIVVRYDEDEKKNGNGKKK